MEEKKKGISLKGIGLAILAIGVVILAFKCYEYRYLLFNLPRPQRPDSNYYFAQEMRAYFQQNPGVVFKAYMSGFGFWYAIAPIALGAVLAIIGKSRDN